MAEGWETCPHFVSSILDPVLKTGVLQTAAVLPAQEEAFTCALEPSGVSGFGMAGSC